MQEYSWQFTRKYPPELRQEPGHTESTERLIEFSINHDYDHSVRFPILWFHILILVWLFAYLFQSALTELLYCEIWIQNLIGK